MPEIGRQQGEPRLWIMALPIGVKQRGYREPMTNIVKPRSTGGRVWQKACTPHQGAKRPLHNGLEAFPAGHATASAALQRLNRFQASNRFYAANRELGRALKTEFVLQYMSEPQLRAKVRRGLLKVEQLHALARAVYYGQRGRISAREVYDQMNACSCLTLILACIVYWQAREISRLATVPDFPVDPDLLRHVSPIEWKNVILYGEIKIDPAKLKMRRP